MKKTHFLLIGFFVFLWSCDNSSESLDNVANDVRNILVIEFQKSENLKVGDFVKKEGDTIGEVIHLESTCSGHRIYATIKLANDIQIPTNSIFRISYSDNAGNKCIEVQYFNSETNFAPGDTVIGLIEMYKSAPEQAP